MTTGDGGTVPARCRMMRSVVTGLMAGPTGAGSSRTHASQQCTPAENIAGIGPAVYFKILRDIANGPEYLVLDERR
jgi:hypothetical protein